MTKTTTIRNRELFRECTTDDKCKVCGRPVVCYDWSEASMFIGTQIANPEVCHVHLGNQVASFWCPRMRGD